MFRPSDEQAALARRCLDPDLRHIIVRGGKGGGKTALVVRLALDWLERTCSGKDAVVSAKTGSLIRGVILPEAKGWAADRDVDAVFKHTEWTIPSLRGREPNRIELKPFGEKQASNTATGIQGPNYSLSLVDEAVNAPKAFLDELLGGRVRIPNDNGDPPRSFWTLNPDNEYSPFKLGLVDSVESGEFVGISAKLSLTANPVLHADHLKVLMAAYPQEHQRKAYIDGEWSSASGHVYPNAVKQWPNGWLRNLPKDAYISELNAGVDWAKIGVTHGLLIATTQYGYFVIAEWVHDGNSSGYMTAKVQARKMYEAFQQFGSIAWWNVANDGGLLIAALRDIVRGRVHESGDGTKFPVEHMVNKIHRLASKDRFFLTDNCPVFNRQMSKYHYPAHVPGVETKARNNKPVKVDDHGPDAARYWVERVIMVDPTAKRGKVLVHKGVRR